MNPENLIPKFDPKWSKEEQNCWKEAVKFVHALPAPHSITIAPSSFGPFRSTPAIPVPGYTNYPDYEKYPMVSEYVTPTTWSGTCPNN